MTECSQEGTKAKDDENRNGQQYEKKMIPSLELCDTNSLKAFVT